MHKTNAFSITLIALIIIVQVSCVSEQGKNRAKVDSEIKAEPNSNVNEEVQKAKVERIKKIFYSLPSPLELTMLFKKEGVEYYAGKLHQVDKRDHYSISVKKALNLGVYGADLSYSGLFGKHEDAIEYFTTCQIMAEDIGIGQSFRKEFISRIEKNADNRDTLLQVITDFFLDNDAYLKDQRQQDISAYVLTGGWVEGLYLGTQMTDQKSNTQGIKEVIAGQKFSLENLLLLLEGIQGDETISQLKKQLNALNNSFKEIDYGSSSTPESSTKDKNGKLILHTGDSDVNIPDSTFSSIRAQITEIRSAIIE